MGWKAIHRWLGLTVGTLAVVLGVTGAILAIDPVQQAWQAPAAPGDLPVATLVERVTRTVPGAEEIRHLPSGAIVVFSFAGDQPQASYVDPADGRVLGAWQASALPRWVKNLHRSLLLGDAGRWGAAGIALAMGLVCVSALVLLLRRMGGWRRLAARVRGSLAQRIHVVAGRVVLAVLFLTSLTALTMSASTLGLVALDTRTEPEVLSVVAGKPALPGAQLATLQGLVVRDLHKLNFPGITDPEDTWKVATVQGQGWIDRYSGQMLAWQDATFAQRVYDLAVVLHTGEAAWPWAVVLGLVGASVLLFWLSGVVIWWQARRQAPHITGNTPLAQADVLIFVASEGGSTWGFAQTLQDALSQGGHRVHTSALENFRTTAATRQVFVLAATYGEGQAPAHASHALEHIARLSASAVPVTVLGFGDRQFPAFCAFAEALDQTLRAQGWPALLPLECIHQQSGQQFARWGVALAQALGEPLVLAHVPRVPPTATLTLIARQDYPGATGQATAILRFAWPAQGSGARLRGHGLARFAAGDLVGIVPPGSAVPRYYSLASGWEDGFLEICVRQMPDGLCSTHLLGLQTGDGITAFIRSNPGFALPRTRRPVLLIGAGTGVAPLAGFIRRNDRRTPMHLYFGGRDPARDFYFGPEIQRWLGEGRLATLQTVFSRVPDGGGYVQDALRRDAERLRGLLAQGAIVRVCGGRAMAQGVAETLDVVLAPLQLSVAKLKAKERYAEDVF
ncbi:MULTISPECIES: PepSY domain-containing protein [unclassified Polaromonas]|jgi:sulfite reductase (NADPH) flavoprotein alpha-component|uniref:PepSY domain-containing protein n=1 Tax=unclassified Polaromonas TaxID=2638319 RepID=UPI000BDC836C|nr:MULTISPECIES: PepSY domain-containing protein [unclassified Polaromonas]OYY38073.1 MAG: oxidoreductase [Polaromonas sp. 35-63-35]OYZ18515.1 MAG: oxidoreductase [Polaromonas sp. 16-63-31]OYZ79621.1 MAG: oxidoreductase [Polaromonas sp. 24-63-21]OZA50768.1 MAG: oxidoreductase [Polaromonas sp. 17-63-33]OZA89625.1 MAG: oxidoreductase [Polaromonas sp. 39-63-25]